MDIFDEVLRGHALRARTLYVLGEWAEEAHSHVVTWPTELQEACVLTHLVRSRDYIVKELGLSWETLCGRLETRAVGPVDALDGHVGLQTRHIYFDHFVKSDSNTAFLLIVPNRSLLAKTRERTEISGAVSYCQQALA